MNDKLIKGLRECFPNSDPSAAMLSLISSSKSLSGIIILSGSYCSVPPPLLAPVKSLLAIEAGSPKSSDLKVLLPVGPLGGVDSANYALENIVSPNILTNFPPGTSVSLEVLEFLSNRRDIIFRDGDLWSMLRGSKNITPRMLLTTFDQVDHISNKMISQLFLSDGMHDSSKKFFWSRVPDKFIDPDFLGSKKLKHSKIGVRRKAELLGVQSGYAQVVADLVFSGEKFDVALKSLGFTV